MGTTQLGIEGMRIAAAVGGMQGSGVEHHNLLHGSKIFAKLSPSQPSSQLAYQLSKYAKRLNLYLGIHPIGP